ncbi:V-type proton ATPase subunit d1 [Salvia divinorum]|uniref:V-type proton ATPase subunit d1 n=1 Tax=Salvia divinorum TaxID=28513 RepID=A0ABD1FTW0_SALDI
MQVPRFKFQDSFGSRYGHMIDNVVQIVTGTLHERNVQELLEKCHPLGMFDSIATLAVAQNMRELYRLVLVDGSFFFPVRHTLGSILL